MHSIWRASNGRFGLSLQSQTQGDDNEWFVHKGSYENGSLAANPFQEKDLMHRNIATEAWDVSVTKRLRSNSHLNDLRGYVQVNDYLWCELVAVANFRAE